MHSRWMAMSTVTAYVMHHVMIILLSTRIFDRLSSSTWTPTADMDSPFLLLPPHLLERIADILRDDIALSGELRKGLERTVEEAKSMDADAVKSHPKLDSPDQEVDLEKHGSEILEGEGVLVREEARPPVIEIELVENLARWATTTAGTVSIRKAELGQFLATWR